MRKLLLIAIAALTLFITAHVFGAPKSGGPIRIYATGGDIRPKVAILNYRLAEAGLEFAAADTAEEADVQVTFVDGPADRLGWVGRATPLSGRIELVRGQDAEAAVLLHEMLHCAGLSHEDDPSSVMSATTERWQEVRPEHIEALRRLRGMTWAGRFAAAVKVFF
jgi:hypothetical protein